MTDVIDVPLQQALRDLPVEERDGASRWPYL